MIRLPDGVVTFLFTDVEGSTRLWEEAPDSMMEALRLHDEAIDGSAAAYQGISVKPRGEGDSRFVVFRSAIDAVGGSAEMQRRLAVVDWPTPRPLRVRASLHTGLAELELGDYYGSAVNRAARLRAIAHGGQTVLSGATYELVQDQLPDMVTVTDMGRHRLKDLTRPEHVFQLNVDGLDDAFPPLASMDAVPNNLPEQLTELIGREGDLVEINRLLDGARLLTILAPGGTGKTRLAIQAAADRTAENPDGVFFVGLADINSRSEIVQTVAESIGVALSSAEDPQAQLLGYLKSRQLLLVFDNFEHVGDNATIVSEVLKAAPGVSVIATSRLKLNLTGETLFVLAGLKSVWDSPPEAMQAGGVRLFLDAAQRAQPGMALGQADLEPLADILRLTGGMPLGILLAAAWVNVLSISEIATEIAKNLDFLETSMGDVPDRHRSIRAVFDYTWGLLNTQERDIFAGLSVFRGGFTREAAEACAGASLRDLSNLAGKSLVTHNSDTGRYAVHALLRQYAQAELAHDPKRRDAVLDAHADYYGDLTEGAFGLFHLSDQPRMVLVIEQDIENIRLAWRRHLSTGQPAGIRKISLGLYFIYEIRGWYQAAIPLFGEPVDALNEHSDDETVLVARALSAALQAWFLGLLGRQDEGESAAADAVAALRACSDPEALWIALQCWALCLAYQGEDWSAIADEGLKISERLDGPVWAAVMKNWRAGAASMSGDFATGKRLLLEGREVLQRHEESMYLSLNFGHDATIAAREGHMQDAINLNMLAIEAGRKLDHLRSLQLSLTGLGTANLAVGNLEGAAAAFVEDLRIAERMGAIREMLQVMVNLASVRAASGRRSEAVELLAAVVAEPVSSQQTVWETVSIGDTASDTLKALRSDMDSDEYATANAAGTAKSYEVAVKELVDSIS